MARCELVGQNFQAPRNGFAAATKCRRVVTKHPKQGTPGLRPASQRASTRAPRRTFRRGS